MPAITLNAVTIYPDAADKKKNKIGKLQVSANGGRTFLQRVTLAGVAIHKSEWALKWDNATAAIRAQVETLYNVSTTMVYVDQNGASYTVICAEDGYDDSVSIIFDNTTNYYAVSLNIMEI